MREDIRMKVLDLLKTYPDNMRKIAQLNYELAHPSQISATEMLEAMAFKKGNGERHSVGEVSDKTLYIAMNYRNEAFRKNREVFKDYHSLLVPLERETERLRYYISLLDQRQAEVIRLYYGTRSHRRWGLRQSLFAGSVMLELTALQKCMSFPVSSCNIVEAASTIVLRSVG